MVRKQIYIQRRQDALLKRLSRARGQSEAEIIRQAIEREAAGIPSQPIAADRSAWQELVTFLEARHATDFSRQPYRWNREEIYTEREDRWLRDKEQK
jgi:DNA-binding FrmR family transcriptional regulator